MSSLAGLFRLNTKDLRRYSVMNEGEEETGAEWLIQFSLTTAEYDDSFDSDYREEVVIVAPDSQTAYKYAQQYIRLMQMQSETKERWRYAKIVSVHQR